MSVCANMNRNFLVVLLALSVAFAAVDATTIDAGMVANEGNRIGNRVTAFVADYLELFVLR